MSIRAYPTKTGEFVLSADRPSQTYRARHILKANGAKWDGRRWIASQKAVDAVGALIMTRVRVAAHCHEPEQMVYATPLDIRRGTVRLGCGMCDKSDRCGDNVAILEILSEQLTENREEM